MAGIRAIRKMFQGFLVENLNNGSTLTTEAVREKRKDICYGRNGHKRCDQLRPIVPEDETPPLDSYCKVCDCFIEDKTKYDTHPLEGLKKGVLKSEKVKCPLRKWETYFKNLEIE